jgi:hypothetical protein
VGVLTKTVFRVNRKKAIRVLAWCAIGLTALSMAGQLVRYSVDSDPVITAINLLWVANENSFPTFFQVLMLITTATLLFVTGRIQKERHEEHRAWTVLALVFVAMTFDEASSIHELAIDRMRSLVEGIEFFYFGWVVLAIPLVIIFVLSFSRFLLRLDRRTRRTFLIGGALFVVGALGFEMISGAYVSENGRNTLAYSMFLVSAEELLEMTGVLIFLSGVLRFLQSTNAIASVSFGGASTAEDRPAHQEPVERSDGTGLK